MFPANKDKRVSDSYQRTAAASILLTSLDGFDQKSVPATETHRLVGKHGNWLYGFIQDQTNQYITA